MVLITANGRRPEVVPQSALQVREGCCVACVWVLCFVCCVRDIKKRGKQRRGNRETHTHIYTHREREREREKDRQTWTQRKRERASRYMEKYSKGATQENEAEANTLISSLFNFPLKQTRDTLIDFATKKSEIQLLAPQNSGELNSFCLNSRHCVVIVTQGPMKQNDMQTLRRAAVQNRNAVYAHVDKKTSKFVFNTTKVPSTEVC